VLRKPLPCCCPRLLLWPLRAAAGDAVEDEDSAAARRIPVMYPNLLPGRVSRALRSARPPHSTSDRERQPSRRASSSPGFSTSDLSPDFPSRSSCSREPAAGRSRGRGAAPLERSEEEGSRRACRGLAAHDWRRRGAAPLLRLHRPAAASASNSAVVASPRLTSRASYGPESRQHQR
jgi:hypothetical protein